MLGAKETTRSRQLLRYFIFLLNSYPTQLILPTSSRTAVNKLKQDIAAISKDIGVVPRLNCNVELPEKRFLPKNIEITKNKWKAIACPNPSRNASSIDTGKMTFFCKGSQNSVRAALRDQVRNKKSSIVLMSEEKQYYLNLIDTEFYKPGLFDADHLQPSSGLIDRLKEMVEMMNIDPAFKKDMIESQYNDDYFIEENGKVLGTYWFYASYYNAMQNLWFLLTSDNSGSGKVATDPIEWLESNDIGKGYLTYLKTSGRSIDKSGTLYLVLPDGQGLKDSFVHWVETNNARLIRFCQLFSRFHHDFREKMEERIDSKKRHRSSSEVAMILDSATERAVNKDSDESSLGSDPIDRDEVRLRTRKKLKINPNYQAALKETSKAERQAEREARQEIAEEKRKKVVDIHTSDTSRFNSM